MQVYVDTHTPRPHFTFQSDPHIHCDVGNCWCFIPASDCHCLEFSMNYVPSDSWAFPSAAENFPPATSLGCRPALMINTGFLPSGS